MGLQCNGRMIRRDATHKVSNPGARTFWIFRRYTLSGKRRSPRRRGASGETCNATYVLTYNVIRRHEVAPYNNIKKVFPRSALKYWTVLLCSHVQLLPPWVKKNNTCATLMMWFKKNMQQIDTQKSILGLMVMPVRICSSEWSNLKNASMTLIERII
jgi:hypothetical protein